MQPNIKLLIVKIIWLIFILNIILFFLSYFAIILSNSYINHNLALI